MKKFGILAWPAFSNKGDNPYNYFLYSNIEKNGTPVYEFQFDIKNILQSGFSKKYKILHFHWPNVVISAKTHFQASRRLYTFYFFLKIIKLLDKKIVWTVHNLEAHESRFPNLERKLSDILYENVDGFISLNKSGLKLIKERAKSKRRQSFTHIAHPHYKNFYLNTISKEEARETLQIDKDKFVFLFLGQIRPYKNVTGLIKAFKELNDENSILLIAGTLHRDMKNLISEEIENNDRIKLYDKFIKNEDLQYFLNSADIVVTPYNQIFNSGSVFLNLSFNKPTLAPELLIFKELEKTIGTQWIKIYSGSISGNVLLDSIKEIKQNSSEVDTPSLTAFNPETLAEQTTNFYSQLLND